MIGAIAVLFKLVNTAPFFCHLLGVFFLGLAFDAASFSLMKNEKRIFYKSIICGSVSAYGGFALFALVVTYIVRYEPWTAGGWTKVLNHIFISGSLASFMAIMAVPLGFWIGLKGKTLAAGRSQWAFGGALATLIVLWTLGQMVG